MGVSVSYDEAILYEKSIVLGPRIKIKKDSFSQFMFDNTDFNTNTLGGDNPLHSMGCLQSVYPENGFEKIEAIPRLKVKPKAEDIAKIDEIEYYYYENANPSNYAKVVAKKLDIKNVNNENLCNTEFLWLFSKYKYPNLPGWNGFYSKLTRNMPYEKTKLVSRPFIHKSPT